MAFDNPAFVIDGTTIDGEPIRRALGTLIGPAGGIVSPGDLQVTQNGTPNMSVNVAAGQLWMWGQSTTSQGPYYTRNGATVNLAIAASNPTNPRLDQVVVQVQDAAYAGTGKLCQPLIITGTPTAGASLANLVGLGTFPPANSSAYLLAYVLVPANATSIVTADILNEASIVGHAQSWAALTLNHGTATGAYAPSARLEGDIVRFKGAVNVTTAAGFATLPSGLWPSGAVNDLPINNSGGFDSLSITTAGVMSCTSIGTVFLNGVTFSLS